MRKTKARSIKILSYGKINLSIDVGSIGEDGFHPVDMIMCRLNLHDLVKITYSEQCDFDGAVDQSFNADDEGKCASLEIKIKSNWTFVPCDERNICYKAARLMGERFNKRGKVLIELNKKIPVGAGLAGGSGNGAAVLHGLNALWRLSLTIDELCEFGAELGSDVPFSVVAQAKACRNVPKYLTYDPKSCNCARARGRGIELKSCMGMDKLILLVKPKFSVSTKAVYQGIDSCTILERPDNDALERALLSGEENKVYENMVNVLENYTLEAYPQLKDIKNKLSSMDGVEKVLMSGSGPTIYGIFSIKNKKLALQAEKQMRMNGLKVFLTNITE